MGLVTEREQAEAVIEGLQLDPDVCVVCGGKAEDTNCYVPICGACLVDLKTAYGKDRGHDRA